MAFQYYSTIQTYIGLSTDIKPTTCRYGSRCFEYDTKLTYITPDGGTTWTVLSLTYGLIFAGTCNSGMTASITSIACADLAGYGNDYFNNKFYMQIIKNANSIGAVPDNEIRNITDYVSSSGTFTTDAFSSNVEENDEVFIIHKAVIDIINTQSELDAFVIADMDNFDVADADANNERWNVGYISGTEGGSADINTTTSGKLMVKVDPDATPTAGRYAVNHALPLYADFFTVTIDCSATWGATDSATAKATGILFSQGTTWDGNNYIGIERQKGTAINRIQARYSLNAAAEVTSNVNTTDDAVAFKVERWDNVWRLFYSTVQYPTYDWQLVTQVEDSSVYMTDQVTLWIESYSVGSADAESIRGDFDNFRYYIGAGGGGQSIAGDYSSAWVSADIDGNVFERQEAIQKAMGVVGANGGQFESDGVPDLWDAVVVDSSTDANITAITGNRDGAIIERLSAVENTIGITNAATLTGYEEDGSGANLFKTLVAVQGATTAAGTTATFVDTARIEGASYWIGNLIVALSGSAAGQIRTIVGDNGTGTLTVEPLLSAAPGASAVYVILNKKAADWIIGDNTANNAYASGNVVRNDDGSVLERLESIIEDLRGTGGIVTWPGAANIGDTVSIAEAIRAILTSIVGGDDYDAYTNISNSANASLNAIAQKFAIVIGIDTTNTFSSTIQGSGRTTIEAALDAMATYFAASGAALAMKVQDGTERTNFEQILEDYFAIVGCDGTNLFNPTIQGAAQTTFDSAFAQLAVYFAASGAAMSIQLNNQTARTNLEQVLEDYFVLVGVDGTNVLTNINNSANATFNAVWQKFAALWGADGANVFNPTISGAAQTTLDAALGALGGQLSPSGAAISVTMNNGAANATFEEIWEAWLAVVGVDGTNQFTNIANSANITFNAVFQKFATVIGIDNTNTFAPAMFGATPATVEASFTALGTALGAEYDGSPDLYDTVVTGYDSSAITANVDGSVIERLEDISGALSKINYDLSDLDDFDVADADSNTERWNFGYLNGAEGGSSDISTTTAGKLMIKVDPDVTPTAAMYSVYTARNSTSKFASWMFDVNATFSGTSGSQQSVGIEISNSTYDATNRVYIQKQRGATANRVTCGAYFNNVQQGGAETHYVTDDIVLALRVDRLNNVWRVYYSLTQYPNWSWTLLAQYEDASEYMDAQVKCNLQAYSPGENDDQISQGDFDNWKYYIGLAGIDQEMAGDYDSTSIAADEDGSVMERLEQIQEAVNNGTGSPVPANKSLYDIIGATYVDAGGGLGTDSVVSDLGDIHTHTDDIDTDLGEPGDSAAVGSVSAHAKLNGLIAALGVTAALGGKFEVDGDENLWTELKQIPASDGAVTWNNTALASINAEIVDVVNTDDKLDKLISVDDRPAALAYPSSVVGESILAFLMSKSASPAAPSFDNTTDSLEAISDLVTTADAVIDDIDTDLGEPWDTVTINGSVHSKLNGIIAALEITAAGGGKFEIDGAEGLWTQLKEIPASDGTVTWNATALASVNAEVDTALNTIVPASPTAGSLNDILSKAAGGNAFDKATDSLEMLSDKLGAFTGDGGAAQDDSVKASLDLAHTDLDTLITSTVTTVAGRYNVKATTVDLNQIAGSYDLATGTTQNVIINNLAIRLPNVNVSDDINITSISIQTDDVTVYTFVTSVQGLKANLTAEVQIPWSGACLLKVGKKIQLTINGGAADAATVCDVIIGFRAVVSGGNLG